MFKKVVLILAAVCMMAFPLAAFDYGGSLDLSGGAVVSSTTSFSPSVKVTGYAKVPFGIGSFSTEAYYKLDGSFASGVNPSFTNLVDVTLFKVNFAIPAGSLKLNINAGRFAYSDVTSSVFAMTSDGLNVATNIGIFKASAYVGYTGLLNAKTSGVNAAWTYDANSVYALGSKYTVFLANFTAANVLGGNTFSAELAGGINGNGAAATGVSDGYNRFYGTVSAAGPINASIYYSGSVTGSYLTKDTDPAGLLAKGSIVAYLPVMSMSVSGKVGFGTKGFQAITSEPCSGGVLDAGLSVTAKPMSNLLCLATGDIYCGTVGGFAATRASWNLLAKWQIMSDVSTFLSLGQNIPLGGTGSSSFTPSLGGTVSF